MAFLSSSSYICPSLTVENTSYGTYEKYGVYYSPKRYSELVTTILCYNIWLFVILMNARDSGWVYAWCSCQGLSDDGRRMLFIARLPNLVVLNGSAVSEAQREDAERFFIRFYLDANVRPERLLFSFHVTHPLSIWHNLYLNDTFRWRRDIRAQDIRARIRFVS